MQSLTKSNRQSNKNLSTNKQNLSTTPQFINKYSSQQSFVSQTYAVIQSQQKHIRKLQNDLHRKDALIANLLTKNQTIKRKKENIEISQLNNEQMQKIVIGMNQLKDKYQKITHENQWYKSQLQSKYHEIRNLLKMVQEKDIQLQNLQQKIENYKITAQKMKQAYQAKIAKILAEIKNKVKIDVIRTNQKRKLTQQNQVQIQNSFKNYQEDQYIDNKNKFLQNKNISQTKIQKFQYVNQQNPQIKLYTPIKITQTTYPTKSLQVTSKQTSKTKNTITRTQTDKKKLINTPYKICKNFITTDYKNFPMHHNQINLQIPQSFRSNHIAVQQKSNNKKDNNKNKYSKMLGSVQDVQFLTDSYSCDNYSQPDNQNSSNNSNQINKFKINNKQQKISIQKVIQQFSKYNNTSPLSQSQAQSNYTQNTPLKQNKTKPHNITHILETLSQKIKYFQSQTPDNR